MAQIAVIVRPEQHMEVIGQDRKDEEVDSEAPVSIPTWEELHAIPKPDFAVVVILSGEGIIAAQESTPDATVDAMEHADFGRIDDFFARNPRHGQSLPGYW